MTYSSERVAEPDITARYGSPYSRNKYTNHGLTIDTLNYVYVVSKPNGDGVLSIKKKCSFHFSDGHYLGSIPLGLPRRAVAPRRSEVEPTNQRPNEEGGCSRTVRRSDCSLAISRHPRR